MTILSQNALQLPECARSETAKHVAPLLCVKVAVLRILQTRMRRK